METSLRAAGYYLIAGVDEVGRGSLAGPVVAAAVILSPTCVIDGVNDSKTLSARRREQLDLAIRVEAIAVGFGVVQEETIDALNILQATMLAMRRAIEALNPPPDFVLIDGDQSPNCSNPHRLIPSGDRLCFPISAASILAKVARDRIMHAYDLALPQYGFRRHKGYGTPEHLSAIARVGVSPIHRKSFRGVREYV
ncbi:MAG: ribonuclease HII [bacterium]|uniref:Ribonuclease HII n=1 Tax=Candidatus Methylomirabilis tolerans TaxID=3123416 RepID=A0AAJ1AHX5_9BACT|nr:ribonuclease HII [Candidatus Methylomirabilis sp.]